MYDGNPGEIDFGSSQREVRVSEGSSYRESTVLLQIVTQTYSLRQNYVFNFWLICACEQCDLKTMTAYNCQVHTRLWSCGGSATCNCGVVLRDHNDVIEFSCCNQDLVYSDVTPLIAKLRSKKRLAPGILITQTIPGFNSQYLVSLNFVFIKVSLCLHFASFQNKSSRLVTY